MLGEGFNPYFIGLPILIIAKSLAEVSDKALFQSLFYWITYSYKTEIFLSFFIIAVSILILLDYLFL